MAGQTKCQLDQTIDQDDSLIYLNDSLKQFTQEKNEKIFIFNSSDQPEFFLLNFKILSKQEDRDEEIILKLILENMDNTSEVFIDYEGNELNSQERWLSGFLKENTRFKLTVLLLTNGQKISYLLQISTSNTYQCIAQCNGSPDSKNQKGNNNNKQNLQDSTNASNNEKQNQKKTSNEQNQFNSNGICNQKMQICECQNNYIGNSCNIKAKPIQTNKDFILQNIEYQRQKYYTFQEHMKLNVEEIDSFEFVIMLPTGIQQPSNLNLYINSGNKIPLPSNSLLSFINPFQGNSQRVFRIVISQKYFFNQNQEPIPINLTITSQEQSSVVFYIKAQLNYLGIFDHIINALFKSQALTTCIIIGLIIFSVSIYCHMRKKQKTKQQNKIRRNDSLPISNAVEQKDKKETNNQNINKIDIFKQIQFKKNIVNSPRGGKLQLQQIKTLDMQTINTFMPTNLYNNILTSLTQQKKLTTYMQLNTYSFQSEFQPTNQQQMIQDDFCSVCKLPFQLKDQIRKTVCSHIIHDDCLVFYLSKEEECPCCLKSLSKISLFQHSVERQF